MKSKDHTRHQGGKYQGMGRTGGDSTDLRGYPQSKSPHHAPLGDRTLTGTGQVAGEILSSSEDRIITPPAKAKDDDWKTAPQRCKETPKELKQEFLDLMWKGKSIGESRDILGIDLYLALEIMNENTKSHLYLSREAQ